jgi:hypothetical protein
LKNSLRWLEKRYELGFLSQCCRKGTLADSHSTKAANLFDNGYANVFDLKSMNIRGLAMQGALLEALIP